jgi:hypothetical protein
MMRLGSVILKVAPRQVADRMWYFPLLQPYVDHVPVKADLSDLEEKIRWCRENDDKCREIAANCLELYEKYVARSGLLDYVEMVTKHISKRHVDAPKWWSSPPPEQPPPQLAKPDSLCYEDRSDKSKSRLCSRCQDDADAEEREREANQAKAAEAAKAIEQMKTVEVATGLIKTRAEQIHALLHGLWEELRRALPTLEQLVAREQEWSRLSRSERESVASITALAYLIRQLIDAPLFDAKGQPVDDTKLLISAAQERLNAANG